MTLVTNSENSGFGQSNRLDDQLKQVSGKAQKELVDYANGCFTRAKKVRLQFERQWYVNLAFYFGRQYVQWATTSLGDWNRLYEPRVPPWRVRLISNKIRPIVRAELAKVTKEKPRGFVIPSTADDADLAAARAGEAITEHLWRDLLLFKQIRRSEFWTLICGTSFMKDWYDKDRPGKDRKKGAIQVEPVSPFHIFICEAQEEELENQPFVIHSLAKSQEWIRSTYGKAVPPNVGAGSGVLEQQFLQAIGVNSGVTKDYVAVREGWFKPCRKFPDGAVIVWAGEELLHMSEKWPYNHGEFPFTKFDHIPTGRFYSDSTIVDLINLQKEYNRTRSQIIEAKNKMAKPQLVAQLGSINVNKLTSEPGLVIEVKPGFQYPQPLPLTALPAYVIDELDRIQRDMDDISSQHEVTKGRTPPGVSAATAISYLQEEDDSKLSNTISSLEEGTEKLTRHLLSHVGQFWTAERQVQVIGDNGQFESFMFSQSDIRGNTDFKVEAGSATPRSRAAKQAFILELAKMQMIPPTAALKYLEMSEVGRMYEEMQKDARQAQRENLKMSFGNEVPINSFDNHQAHIAEHNSYRKTQQFEILSDEIKTLFERHVEGHKMQAAAAMGMPPMMPGDPQLNALSGGPVDSAPGLGDIPPEPMPAEGG